MNTEENAIKRSKARKNKENIHFNKISSERGVQPHLKSGMDLTKLLLKKKPRQKLKDSLNFTSNGLFKRYSFQVENESKAKKTLIERGLNLGALRKKMSMNQGKKEDMKKNRNRKGKIEALFKNNNKGLNKGLKSHLRQAKRKEKTLSSNNSGISRLFKNKDQKNEEKSQNGKIPPSRSNKTLRQFEAIKRKKSFKKQKLEEAMGSSENKKLKKPPQLLKPANYASHSGIRRIRVNGLIKRKQSLNAGTANQDQTYLSKPNSPRGQTSFQISPRYFKTLNKDSGQDCCFIPAPKICRPNKSHTKRLLRIKEEGKVSRKDNLKRILAKKNSRKLLKNQISNQNTSQERKGLANKLSQNVSEVQAKSPLALTPLSSPLTPLNQFIAKKNKKIKNNNFSFNKSSKENLEKVHKKFQTSLNNTSLLFSYGMNSSKNQNSFIFLKNKMGEKDQSIILDKSKHSRNESFGGNSRKFLENCSRVHKSFLLKKQNLNLSKKRSKSFYESGPLGTSIHIPTEYPSQTNLSLLKIPNFKASGSFPKPETEFESLNKLIRNMTEREDQRSLSVKTIEEESEFSLEQNAVFCSKRSPTLKGNDQDQLTPRIRLFSTRSKDQTSKWKYAKSFSSFSPNWVVYVSKGKDPKKSESSPNQIQL